MKSKNPLFSILIANYNNGKFFQDCYNSIIAQNYDNWEVIIVDDGSTDNSVDVIQKMIGEDSRFHFFENSENKGCGYTKRKCVELANGELCGFLDPDDALTEEALSVMVSEHVNRKEATIIYSNLYWCNELLETQRENKSKQIENEDPYFFDFDGRINHFLSFKKSLYNKTLGIDPYLQRAIDKDLVLKLYEVGPCYYVDKTLYKYRVHSGGISMTTNQDKAFYWYWVTIIDAARRRNINIEDIYVEKALISRRDWALQKELDGYNASFIFKVFRKIGLFRI